MIKVGDPIPSAQLTQVTPDGPKELSTDALFGGKKVVLFAVPGAFTPTCSARHMPGFLQHLPQLAEKGVDTVACIAVNDPFVLGAWAKDQGVDGRVTMLADGGAVFTRALGLDTDLTARGMGVRSRRYAMVVENGTVTSLGVEKPGEFEVSSAETVLDTL